MSQTVVIEDLQVGMFVHLDLGWWAHPFALSSFLVTSPDQINTIRGLGLKQLRWSPEKSRLAQAPAAVVPDATEAAAHARPGPAADTAPVDDPVDDPTPAARAVVTSLPAAPAPQDPLAAQHAARQLCEQQYSEAGRAWHQAQALVPKAPAQARAVTEGLTRSLLDKMMVDREMCVRVISDVGGDRVSGHALNVAVIALLMGRVFGFGSDDMLDLGVGALLHDVGKLELPERVRHPDLPLNPRELQAYRDHVGLGVALGQRMGLGEGALTVLAQHHEMADGSGFPAGLNLDRMAIGARIVSLVNRYDNLCNPAQLAAALTPHEALSLIFAQSRTKFDATMLNAFIRMMGVYPPGSLVQLTDDRYATVVSCNSSRPLKPRVLVCDTRVPVEEALLLNLDAQTDLGIRRSLKATQLPAAARDYLSPRQRMVYFFEPAPADAAGAVQAMAA
jgi:putative nucleotidyltransferase with HDIG domain